GQEEDVRYTPELGNLSDVFERRPAFPLDYGTRSGRIAVQNRLNRFREAGSHEDQEGVGEDHVKSAVKGGREVRKCASLTAATAETPKRPVTSCRGLECWRSQAQFLPSF